MTGPVLGRGGGARSFLRRLWSEEVAQQSGQVVGIGPEALTVGLDDVEHTTSQLEEATQTLRAFLQHVQQAAEARQQWAAEKAAEIAQDYLDEG